MLLDLSFKKTVKIPSTRNSVCTKSVNLRVNILYIYRWYKGLCAKSHLVPNLRQMANSTESYGLSKFEKLQNCFPSSDTTEARLVEILMSFCSHRGVDE